MKKFARKLNSNNMDFISSLMLAGGWIDDFDLHVDSKDKKIFYYIINATDDQAWRLLGHLCTHTLSAKMKDYHISKFHKNEFS